MKRLDLHLFMGFIKHFFMAEMVFLILFVAISVMDELSFFIRFNASFKDAAMLITARSPLLMILSMPLAALLGVTASVTILSRNGEITALRASGISLLRIARPYLLGAAAVAALHFAMQETVLPGAQALAQEVEMVRIRKKPPTSLIRDDNVWFRYGSNMIHADRIKPDDKTMTGVTVYEWDGSTVKSATRADSARWSGREWVLEDARTWTFVPGRTATETRSEKLPYPVAIPPDELSVIRLEPQFASMAALGRRMETLKLQGAVTTSLEVEFWKKTALPFASILMPFLAIPFAVRATPRSGLWSGVAAGIVTGFIFIAATMALSSLGKMGLLPPWPAAWMGNLLFIPLSLKLMNRAEKSF